MTTRRWSCRRAATHDKEGVSAGLTPPASPPPMRSSDWSCCDRARTLGSLTDLELNSLVIVQRIAPTNLGMVDEQIFSATVDRDKAKALIAVEPFDGSLSHALNFLMLADLEEHTASQFTRCRVNAYSYGGFRRGAARGRSGLSGQLGPLGGLGESRTGATAVRAAAH